MTQWMDALKAWNAKKKGKWVIPKKGSKEHAEVMKMMKKKGGSNPLLPKGIPPNPNKGRKSPKTLPSAFDDDDDDKASVTAVASTSPRHSPRSPRRLTNPSDYQRTKMKPKGKGKKGGSDPGAQGDPGSMEERADRRREQMERRAEQRARAEQRERQRAEEERDAAAAEEQRLQREAGFLHALLGRPRRGPVPFPLEYLPPAEAGNDDARRHMIDSYLMFNEPDYRYLSEQQKNELIEVVDAQLAGEQEEEENEREEEEKQQQNEERNERILQDHGLLPYMAWRMFGREPADQPGLGRGKKRGGADRPPIGYRNPILEQAMAGMPEEEDEPIIDADEEEGEFVGQEQVMRDIDQFEPPHLHLNAPAPIIQEFFGLPAAAPQLPLHLIQPMIRASPPHYISHPRPPPNVGAGKKKKFNRKTRS